MRALLCDLGSMRCALRASFLLGLAAFSAASRAPAAGPPAPDRIQSAAQEFDTGRRAYLAGDFGQAAVHFENAYHDAPRPEPLRSAIRARLAAHDDARAATLASLASARYADDQATVALANETLATLSPRLLGVTVACDPECAVAADGRAVSLEDATSLTFYLAPGKHAIVVGWPSDRERAITVEGPAGSIREVRVIAPPLPPAPAPMPAPAAPPLESPRPAPASVAHTKPLGPGVFAVGAGLTAAGIAATIVSGVLATNDPGTANVKRDCVGLGASCPEYQRGLSAQLRTNVLLGATAGVGLTTAVIGVFFTQWSRPAASASSVSVSPYASVAPGALDLGVRATF
jgi:hypothetical protein